jgi:hypothetical protein
MNNMMTRYSKALAAVAAVFALGASAIAEVVYDNSAPASYLGVRQFSTTEFGDQVILSGTQRTLETFSFDYYLNAKSGNESITFNLYRNDGPGGAPKTSLLAAPIVIPAALLLADPVKPSTVVLGFDPGTPLQIVLPDTLTWTVLFGGIDTGESAVLLAYNPATVGSGYTDFWDKSGAGGTWQTKLGSGFVASFGATITAVPEASTLGYTLIGGLIGICMAGYRRLAAKRA